MTSLGYDPLIRFIAFESARATRRMASIARHTIENHRAI